MTTSNNSSENNQLNSINCDVLFSNKLSLKQHVSVHF